MNETPITIFDLVQMRIALEQIKTPSSKIIHAMEILEEHIHNFTVGLTQNQKGN